MSAMRFRALRAMLAAAVGAAALGGAGATAAPPPPGVIAEGVSIGGLDVSGMTRGQARAAVLSELVAPKRVPIPVAFRGRFLELEPVRAGYVAKVDYALKGALNFGRSRPAQRIDVPLRERVRDDRIEKILRWYNRRFARDAKSATLTFRGATPVATRPRLGLEIDIDRGIERVSEAILVRDRQRYRLPVNRYRPKVTGARFGVLIDQTNFSLRLFKGEKRMRSMSIAVGMPSHPTPTGLFEVTRLDKNPVWYPPDSRWAEGLGPVEPGRGNPLGTRWMGISAYAIGIHGTPQPETRGSRASHGCIRLSIADAEWLFNLIGRGSPVRVLPFA